MAGHGRWVEVADGLIIDDGGLLHHSRFVLFVTRPEDGVAPDVAATVCRAVCSVQEKLRCGFCFFYPRFDA